MKNLIRRRSKIAIYSMLIILASAIFCTPQNVSAQSLRIAQISDVWYASYTVTIEGSGFQEPEVGSGDPEITWSVKRIYTGSVKLANGVLFDEAHWKKAERDTNRWSERNLRFTDPQPQVHVQIKDYVHKKYDPTCAEYQTTIETWETDARGFSAPNYPAKLTIDNAQFFHYVSFPTMYFPKTGFAADLKYQKETFQFPKGTVKSDPPQAISLVGHRIPDIKEWLERNGEINHTDPMFPEKDTPFIIESEAMPVNESLLKDVDTSGKVSVKIIYTLKKFKN